MPAADSFRQFTKKTIKDPKEWKLAIKPARRNHLVNKLLQTIYLNTGLPAVQHTRMRNIVRFYLRKREADFFTSANSLDEYLQLCAEETKQIQNALKRMNNRIMFQNYTKS